MTTKSPALMPALVTAYTPASASQSAPSRLSSPNPTQPTASSTRHSPGPSSPTPITYLIRRQPRTQHRSNRPRVHSLRQNRQIIRIQTNILLEASIFMMQMIRAFANTMLLLSSKAEFAAPADARGEADADELPDVDVWRAPWT